MSQEGRVSEEEIAREVRTLRNLRRRSGSGTGPGALAIDPDLPPPSPGSHSPYDESEASTSYSSNDDVTIAAGFDGDSAGLWVPAHLHPELAPGEFMAFLKSNTSSDPEHADASDAGEAAGLARSPSWLARRDSRRGDGLGRKRSMLSKQYTPRAGDHVEDERPPVPSRHRASIYGGKSGEKGLTLEDLQKLEMLVEEAAESDDPAAMTQLLRRSLSVNQQAGFLQDDIPAASGEGAGALPARPSSILRRSAHTKIRKSGLAGDGGGHRFASQRKGRMTAAPVIDIPGLEDDDGAGPSQASQYWRAHTPSDESEDSAQNDQRRMGSTDSHGTSDSATTESRRPSDGSTDETTIFDAYARDSRQSSLSTDSSSRSESPSPEGSPPRQHANLAPQLELPKSTSGGFDWFKDEGEKTPTQETAPDPLAGFRRPSPGESFAESRPAAAHLAGSLNLEATDATRISPPFHDQMTPKASHHDLPPGMAPPAGRQATSQGIAVQPQPSMDRPTATRADSKEKEKEKKGGLFSKKDKKSSKKEKDSFLGSLFGGNKKKQEEPVPVSNFSSAGPAAAAALLGASKSSKSMGHSPGASPTSPSFNSFARYPIHVERAVYRLSHIKLANARRPLYEQVLISNLMFWYLGVIGRNVAEEKKANGEDEKANAPKPNASKGTPPRAADSGVAGVAPVRTPEPPSLVPTPAPGKKTGLTKPDRSRQPGRDAEAPVRTPSYGMQTVQVDHELRNANMAMASLGLKGPPRPPSLGLPAQTSPQQAPPYQERPPPQQQPPLPHSPHRANSQPPPSAPGRTLSPPAPGQARPVSDYGQSPPQRPPPQPVFNAGTAHSQSQPNGMSQSHSMQDVREGRSRTYSNPPQPQGPYPGQPGHPAQGSPNGANGQPQHMRRVVSEARTPTPPQHSGPQPGQIFRLPQQQAPPPQSPGYGPRPNPHSPPPQGVGRGYAPPQGHQRPPSQPPMGGGGPQLGQVYRGPPQGPAPPTFANGARPSVPWEPPQRLPPGASPPPSGTSPYRNGPGGGPPPGHSPQMQQRSPPHPQGYDPRSYPNGPPSHGYQQGQLPPGMQPSYSGSPHQQYQSQPQPQPQPLHQPQYQQRPSPQGMRVATQPPRVGGGPPPPGSPGFNPYGPGPGGPVQRQRSTGDQDMYRRAQPVQQVPYGAHHR